MSEPGDSALRMYMVCLQFDGKPVLVDVKDGTSMPLVDHMLIAVRGYWLPMESEPMGHDDA